jgi:hypothetical protein
MSRWGRGRRIGCIGGAVRIIRGMGGFGTGCTLGLRGIIRVGWRLAFAAALSLVTTFLWAGC